ncbi:magnesium-translocating P-type ATPase [Xylocopilactobacillus apicola]|uniref:Magnesium-transporting ATPase, P-type 1 n=1 Tax=Xylocopilactobacillus apicola TaxID=2932184 RepID=A0AAU9D9P3_9LACO|nr:magnesium-translocating P-type ATPase [Xylocopilactobacillus apicola]BDR59141.1 magnesium-translocating P-type ATPase [Xylocopilactobacillus apicola]
MYETKDYIKIAQQTPKMVLQIFDSQLSGLKKQDLNEQREKYGSNKINYQRKTPLSLQFLQAFVTPFTIVLAILGLISFCTDYLWTAPADRDLMGTIIISVMVLASGTMTLIQSVKSNNAADKLQSMVKVKADVYRDGYLQEVSLDDIVVGDIVKLAAGDMIPADLRLLQTRDLFISQAALTGESYPVEKLADYTGGSNEDVTDYQTLAFMGSNVVSGTAVGLVIAVGSETRFGQVTQSITNNKPTPTNFDLGISQTSWLLIRFMAVMAPIVCILNGLTKGDWAQALLFALSTAVGLTPEMLPMIVTTNLVRGALKMSKSGTIVKNVNSIQNFGAMDILCTDKTGTLTQDKIILEYHYNVDHQEEDRILKYAYLNSRFQTGLKNLMDKAVIKAADSELSINDEQYEKIDELPFDFSRRRMSTIVKEENGEVQMITKGAIEEMLSVSSQVLAKGKTEALTAAWKDRILEQVADLNQDGLRVLGLAIKTNPQPSIGNELSINDESEMIFLGYLAFLDPPKSTAQKAIQALNDHGTKVKIITGDSLPVTQAVCRNIGFDAKNVLTGSQMSELASDELAKVVEENNVFVKVSPEQKAEIVQTLRNNGHVVGFLGDGINDAPSLKTADVGISVDTAVDIAKQSASIVLLQKDLMILEQGVVSGRQTFGNIMKYIKATCSSNFGNVFSVLCASAFLPFLPMQPMQLLLLNLIYDLSCLSIPWDNMDQEYLRVPRKWEAKSISSFMKDFGPTSSVFDITTYLAMYFLICPAVIGAAFGATSGPERQQFIQLFNSGWFVESLWTQTLVLHVLRTEKIPFIQSRASGVVTLVTSIALLFGSVLPFTGLGKSLQLTALPVSFWFLLVVTCVAYIMLVTVVKRWYIKKTGALL